MMNKQLIWKMTLVMGCCLLGIGNSPLLYQSILKSPLVAYAQTNSTCLPLPPGVSPLALLKLSPVQKELQLSDRQINELSKIDQGLQTELTQVYHRSKPNSQTWSQEDKSRLFRQIQGINLSKTKELNNILRPPQFTRLKEIMIQVYGWQSLNNEESIELLQLTKDQQNRLRQIGEETNQRVLQTFEIPSDNNTAVCQDIMAENHEKLEQIRQESQQKADNVLSPKQRQLIETLQGKPVDLNLSSSL